MAYIAPTDLTAELTDELATLNRAAARMVETDLDPAAAAVQVIGLCEQLDRFVDHLVFAGQVEPDQAGYHQPLATMADGLACDLDAISTALCR